MVAQRAIILPRKENDDGDNEKYTDPEEKKTSQYASGILVFRSRNLNGLCKNFRLMKHQKVKMTLKWW